MHTGGVFSTLYGKPSPSTETISKSNESGCSSTVPGGQENFQVPLQQPSGSSGFSLLDSFLDAQYGKQEGSITGSSSKVLDNSSCSSFCTSSCSAKVNLRLQVKLDSMMAGDSEDSTVFETCDQLFCQSIQHVLQSPLISRYLIV